MTTAELEQYLHKHIPLSKAMQVAVISCDEDSMVLSAPLAPNINHRETVFGGSASALAILSAWSLLHTRLLRSQIQARLVIQRNVMNYDLPIEGNFTASASLENPEQWETFVRMLHRKGRSRMSVLSTLEYQGELVGRFSGEFVALGSSDRNSSVNSDASQAPHRLL